MESRKVFLIRNVSVEKYGGGETYQIKLGLMLKKNGFSPLILTSSDGLIEEAREDGIDTIKMPYIDRQNWSGWRNILFPVYFIEIMKLRKWYRQVFDKYKPEMINIQSRDDWIAATVVAKKWESKYYGPTTWILGVGY